MNDETENGNKAPDGDQLVQETNSGEPGSGLVGSIEDVPALADELAADVERSAAAVVIERTESCGLEAPHGRHPYAGLVGSAGSESWGDRWCPGVEAPAVEDLGTYASMFAAYLKDQTTWITKAHAPLVFHIRKLCQKLDADPNAAASFSSAYLQAVSRLDRQRPGNAAAGVAGDPKGTGQRSIFDELEE